MIRMQYKLEKETLNSRRGKYQVAILEHNPVIWTPQPLDPLIPRHLDVITEIDYALTAQLYLHKYWLDEPAQFVKEYQRFYRDLLSLKWLHQNEDRHSIVFNDECCLTSVQYHNHRLIAYSRSTDMKNGYHSDRLLLEYLVMHINALRPDCHVNSIEWFLAIPHVYKQKGIARLTKDEEIT